MIPKIFHRIWLGSDSIPPQHEFWWQAWQRLYPDYSFHTWTETEFERETGKISLTYDKACDATSYAMKSDILRIAILAEVGGIYIDTDMMPINRFEFSDFEKDILICSSNNAIIGSPKNGQTINYIFDMITKIDIASNMHINVVNLTGPVFIHYILSDRDIEYADQKLFYPYHHDESLSKIFTLDLDNTYAAHVWHGSWYNEFFSHQKIFNLFSHGNIYEMKEAMEISKYQKIKSMIADQINMTENIRNNVLQFIHSTHLINALNFSEENFIVFSPFKICQHLNDIKSEITAWSIGTGNGHVNNPLRAAIAHFDIATIFVEPSPYLKEKIEDTFKRNSNIKVIDKAFFPSSSKITMRIFNRQKQPHPQLPDWVENLSHTAISGINAQAVIPYYNMTAEDFEKLGIDKCFENAEVDTIDAKTLFEMNNNITPDIVSIEVNCLEGMILSDIFQNGIRPKMLVIINTGISGDMSEYLEHINYKIISHKNNFNIAVSFEYMKEYCNYLFLEFGIRSIYDLCVKSLVPN